MGRTSTGSTGGRPMILSTRGVVSSGHYLATEIGLDVLRHRLVLSFEAEAEGVRSDELIRQLIEATPR